MKSFAHLHNHDIYSVQDSISDIKDYIKTLDEYNNSDNEYKITGFAICNHGNAFSITKLMTEFEKYNKKAKTKIKPIIGNELYHCRDRATAEDNIRNHLIIIPYNEEGLTNFYRMSSDAGLNPVIGKTKLFPRIDDKGIESYGKGLIASSACLGGELSQMIIKNATDEELIERIEFYKKCFDYFYLELQPHIIYSNFKKPKKNEEWEQGPHYDLQKRVNDKLVEMSIKTNTELILTCDAHYTKKEYKKYHDILKHMAHQLPFTVDAHLKTPEEMKAFFLSQGYPSQIIERAIQNTVKISDLINIDIKPKDELGLLPVYKCPNGYTSETYLRQLCNDKVMEYISKKKIKNVKKYIDRMNYELSVICPKGFSDYFLILWDWIKWCRENRILTGPGRGSAAGSLVSYLLDITKVDPIKNKFIFERFLTPLRDDPPDVDTDICQEKRGQAVAYAIEKYGTEYVGQIITFGKYNIKNTIRAVLSYLEVDIGIINSITKPIPTLISGLTITLEIIEEAPENPDKYPDFTPKHIEELKNTKDLLERIYEEYPEVYDALQHVKGAISSTGCHAGGVVLSGKKLTENVCMIKGSEKVVLPVIQLEMTDLGTYNLLKYDMLGLQTLTTINKAMDLIGLDYSWYDSEDYFDSKVYDMLRKGETTDVFQMSAFSPTNMIKKMIVDTIEALSVVNAGNRPGPLAKDKETNKSMVDNYIDRRTGKEISKIHPLIDDLLKDTYGCIWYQEDCMALAMLIAGYDAGGSDSRIRKILGKKLLKKIPEIRNEFLYGKQSIFKDDKVVGISDEDSIYCIGAQRNGFDLKIAEKVFDDMVNFAKYSFNRSHSFAYATIGYKTAWLSCYYPEEYAIACASTYGKKEKILDTLKLCKKRKISILPPNINTSKDSFNLELKDNKKCIRYGITAIDGLGASALKMIKELKDKIGHVNSFEDFVIKYTESDLVKDYLNKLSEQTGKRATNPIKKNSIEALIKAGCFDEFNSNRYALLNEYKQLRKSKGKTMPLYIEDKYNKLVCAEMEKATMETYISYHPLDDYPYVNIDELENMDIVELSGFIVSIEEKYTKKRKKYATLEIETLDRKIKCNMWEEVYLSYKNDLEVGDIVVLAGEYNSTYKNITVNIVNDIIDYRVDYKEHIIPEEQKKPKEKKTDIQIKLEL
jgi:DNA polymerase III subunit alpha